MPVEQNYVPHKQKYKTHNHELLGNFNYAIMHYILVFDHCQTVNQSYNRVAIHLNLLFTQKCDIVK